MNQTKLDMERKTLQPIFPDDLNSTEFSWPKLIRVADMDKKHAESELCKGSIGYLSEHKGMRVVNVYTNCADRFGIAFYPNLGCEFYYVNPTDRDHFIALDDYFSFLRAKRVNELIKIAQDLGAKHFRITYLEERRSSTSNNAKAEGKGLLKGLGKAKADAETNEHPAHLVNLPTFYIAQFPITQNIWEIVMGYNKSHFSEKEKQLAENLPKQSLLTESESAGHLWPSYHTAISSSKSSDHCFTFECLASLPKGKGQEWLNKINKFINPESSEIGHYPAENLSHDEAIEFVNRLSLMTNIPFSLPTEEEWEYAARGGKKSKGCIYAGSDNIDEVAWYQLNADNSTHPVGMKQPNELGLFDMCGNVWEWTETPAHIYGMDIVPGNSVFIRRGGSWAHPNKNCRVSRRYPSNHSKKTSGLGLRVVIRKNIK